jgi:transaldolase
MKPTQALHEAGQSLWLDNITRTLLDGGTLARYVAEYSVTGLTSNPTIFDQAIRDGTAYDADITARKAAGATDERVFFDLALVSSRWARLANEGARVQRLLWASTSVEDPQAPGVLYVEALAAPLTVNTMPDQTLEAFADHGAVGELLPADGGDADQVIAAFARAGIDPASLAAELQRQGAEAFVASWRDLLAQIGARHEQLAGTA